MMGGKWVAWLRIFIFPWREMHLRPLSCYIIWHMTCKEKNEDLSALENGLYGPACI
ncbi:hypothetical protein ACB092_05G089000 [Castanea dentata]